MFSMKNGARLALGIGCFVLVACGNDNVTDGHDDAGTDGEDGNGSASGGAATGGRASGGDAAQGGEAATGGAVATGGDTAQGGEGGAHTGGDTGSGGSPGSCSGASALSFVGDFTSNDGRKHWLRTTATATTYAVIPGGVATTLALPELEILAENCENFGFFVTERADSKFSRFDFEKEGSNLWLCGHGEAFTSKQAAVDAPAADPSSLIQGCESGPWLGLTKVVAP